MEKAKEKFVDAHCHLDRALTAVDSYWSHARLSVEAMMQAPLKLKQSAMGKLHMGAAYEKEELKRRMTEVVRIKAAAGEGTVFACIDTSPDLGLSAFETALEVKSELADVIDLKIGAYPIFGFKTYGSDRYQLLREACPLADFLVALPERDDRDGHREVGFDGHTRLMLELAQEFKKPVHFHLDQANVPTECGTETLIEAVRWLGSPDLGDNRPSVWAVHVISPSCYDEERFRRLCERLLEYRIGVIVCPHAAISMRQIRTAHSPVHNCIARVREMLALGIPVGLGTDNIGDIFVGLRRPDLGREIEMIQSAVRYYDEVMWQKIARGLPLDDVDISRLEQSLEEDKLVFQQYL